MEIEREERSDDLGRGWGRWSCWCWRRRSI